MINFHNLKHLAVSREEMPSKSFACARLMTRLTGNPSSLHTMAVTTIHISLCSLSYNACSAIIHALISCRLDYCNSLLYNVLRIKLIACKDFRINVHVY